MARARKYPIGAVGVGDSVLIPWIEDGSGGIAKDQDPIHAAVRQEQRRTGKLFQRRREPGGLRVTRTA